MHEVAVGGAHWHTLLSDEKSCGIEAISALHSARDAALRDLAAARANLNRLTADYTRERARAERAEADAAALRAAIEQAPHGPECSAWTTLMGLVGKSLPCDCWKARALAAAPAPKEGTDA